MFASSHRPLVVCRVSYTLLPQGCGGGVGDAAFVALPTSPNPLWSMRSAAVSLLPHSHPEKVLPELQAETGPSSTVLCPHSSHTRMISLEELFTGQPPRYHVQVYLLTFNG